MAQNDQDNRPSDQNSSPSNLAGDEEDEEDYEGMPELVEMLCLPCRPFATGDIAYNSMVLGREGYDKYWCNRCNMGKPEWLKDAVVGDPLNHNLLYERLEIVRELEKGGRKLDAQERQGVKSEPTMVHHIPIKYFLVPILHSVDMVVNIVYKKLQAWLLSRVEIVPMHIYKKREQVVTAGVFKDDSDAWLEQNEMEEEALYHKLYALEQHPPTSRSKKKRLN